MPHLRWKTPPPPISSLDEEITSDWANRLIQWLRDQEEEEVLEVESIVSLGGHRVAERLVGFESFITGYTPVHTETLLAAPAAGKRRILVGFTFHSQGITEEGHIRKTKSGVDYILVGFDTSSPSPSGKDPEIVAVKGIITLDDITESLTIEITVGSADIYVTGSYLEVD
jgi:hypothetical protein